MSVLPGTQDPVRSGVRFLVPSAASAPVLAVSVFLLLSSMTTSMIQASSLAVVIMLDGSVLLPPPVTVVGTGVV